MATLIEQLLQKMGLNGEKSLINKTTELLRLLDLRSVNVPLQLSEYAKTLICADIAAAMLGITFDLEQAVRLSSLRKSQYMKNKRMSEKLLDLNKILSINDICVQLNLTEVSSKATELLDLYKAVACKENAEYVADLVHPQYPAMAVFHACKIAKCKVPKIKLLSFSNLRPTQWHKLELHWENFLNIHFNPNVYKTKQQKLNATDDQGEQISSSPKNAVTNSKPIIEDYEKWKQRMLSMAENKLKIELQLQQNDMLDDVNKENYILGV